MFAFFTLKLKGNHLNLTKHIFQTAVEKRKKTPPTPWKIHAWNLWNSPPPKKKKTNTRHVWIFPIFLPSLDPGRPVRYDGCGILDATTGTWHCPGDKPSAGRETRIGRPSDTVLLYRKHQLSSEVGKHHGKSRKFLCVYIYIYIIYVCVFI